MLLYIVKSLRIEKRKIGEFFFSWVIYSVRKVMKIVDLIFRMKEILYYVYNLDTVLYLIIGSKIGNLYMFLLGFYGK